jgi:peroxiredoxin
MKSSRSSRSQSAPRGRGGNGATRRTGGCAAGRGVGGAGGTRQVSRSVGARAGDSSRNREPEFAGSSMPTAALPPGTVAPDFDLHTTPDQKVNLHEFRGRPVILCYYPADWSPVCGDQLALYNEILPEFNRYEAQLLGISVDGVWCHAAYAQNRNLHFPLLADFHPKGQVAQEYGVYRHQDGVCERALFVVDRDGLIFWSYVSPVGVNPGADGILHALEQLSSQKELAHA